MPPTLLLSAIIVSAGLGAIIGLIRQWSEQTEKSSREDFSGVRTFTFCSMLGCVAAYLTEAWSPAVLPVALALLGLSYLFPRSGAAEGGGVGSTTFVAVLIALLVGALVQWRQQSAAALVTALSVVLLGLKQPIHAWTRRFTEADIRASLQFIAITGVILPLVPDRAFGPFGGFNLDSTWMMVVRISGVGFAGYVLMRLLGARSGLILTSLLGGIASSTATTLAFSRRSREDPAHAESYAMAVALACTVMLPRLLVLLLLVSPDLAASMVPAFALMALPGLLTAGLIAWRQRGNAGTPDPAAVGNPLSLSTAIKFALLYSAITFGVKAIAHYGHLRSGLLPLSFVSGLTDLDAISLSVAENLNSAQVGLGLAAQAILVAAIANSVVKGVLAVWLGRGALRGYVAVLMACTVAAGALAALYLVGE